MALLAGVLLPGASAGALDGEQPPLNAFAQTNVRDLSLTLALEAQNQDELGRMGKDFANLYRFSKAKLQFLEPGRMRMESRAGFITVIYVVNEGRKLFSVPGIGVRSVRDVSQSPSSQQSLLEVGLITPALVKAVEATPLGSDTVNGTPVWRYDIRFTAARFPKRQEIALDPETRTLIERVLYHNEGTVKVRFEFRDPVEVAEGIWVPRRVEVYSPRGKRAAATRSDNIRVNSDLDPETFAF
jgi:outer membrane lipoprotein-sorting protein